MVLLLDTAPPENAQPENALPENAATESVMTDNAFESRVRAAGLRPWPEDMPKLEALVRDLDRAAVLLRLPRAYGQEPLSAFRLRPAARPER